MAASEYNDPGCCATASGWGIAAAPLAAAALACVRAAKAAAWAEDCRFPTTFCTPRSKVALLTPCSVLTNAPNPDSTPNAVMSSGKAHDWERCASMRPDHMKALQ